MLGHDHLEEKKEKGRRIVIDEAEGDTCLKSWPRKKNDIAER